MLRNTPNASQVAISPTKTVQITKSELQASCKMPCHRKIDSRVTVMFQLTLFQQGIAQLETPEETGVDLVVPSSLGEVRGCCVACQKAVTTTMPRTSVDGITNSTYS